MAKKKEKSDAEGGESKTWSSWQAEGLRRQQLHAIVHQAKKRELQEAQEEQRQAAMEMMRWTAILEKADEEEADQASKFEAPAAATPIAEEAPATALLDRSKMPFGPAVNGGGKPDMESAVKPISGFTAEVQEQVDECMSGDKMSYLHVSSNFSTPMSPALAEAADEVDAAKEAETQEAAAAKAAPFLTQRDLSKPSDNMNANHLSFKFGPVSEVIVYAKDEKRLHYARLLRAMSSGSSCR
jgi:hypothetical protein